MKYRSTAGTSPEVGFREAVLSGLAPDGGLYMPQYIPLAGEDLLYRQPDSPVHTLAIELLQFFTGDDVGKDDLTALIRDTFDFPLPLVPCGPDGACVLELFHGPTWAFKDAGARFLGGCLDTWSRPGDARTVVLVATSGDTGGAVAHGFYGRKTTDVIILYPKDQITPLQEQQIAGAGKNIHAIAVEGSFDNCQRLVKTMLLQQGRYPGIRLTSANSINIARWLPQAVFYAWAWQEALRLQVPLHLYVPSGNYGNISAALLSHLMGFRFQKITATHNANDTVPRFLEQAIYQPGPVRHTLANAMDVSDPGNFPRFAMMLQQVQQAERDFFSAVSVSDQQILDTIRQVWEHYGYLLDPHTATAWYTMMKERRPGIIVATAHPFKFEHVIRKALGDYPENWRKDFKAKSLDIQTMEASMSAFEDIVKPFLHTA